MKNNNKAIGALWVKKSKDNMEYLSGSLDLGPLFSRLNIVAFLTDKKNEGQPDYRIFISQSQSKDQTPF